MYRCGLIKDETHRHKGDSVHPHLAVLLRVLGHHFPITMRGDVQRIYLDSVVVDPVIKLVAVGQGFDQVQEERDSWRTSHSPTL